MSESRLSTEARQKYTTAYAAQYTTKDTHKAFTLYADIIADHPNTEEAGYAKSQIQNIVKSFVPEEKFMDSLVGLARIHFEKAASLNAELASA